MSIHTYIPYILYIYIIYINRLSRLSRLTSTSNLCRFKLNLTIDNLLCEKMRGCLGCLVLCKCTSTLLFYIILENKSRVLARKSSGLPASLVFLCYCIIVLLCSCAIVLLCSCVLVLYPLPCVFRKSTGLPASPVPSYLLCIYTCIIKCQNT